MGCSQCGCGASAAVAPQDPKVHSVLPTTSVPIDPEKTTFELELEKPEVKICRTESDDRSEAPSSNGSGPPGPSLVEQLYAKMRTPADIFQLVDHDACFFGGTALRDGVDSFKTCCYSKALIEQEFEHKRLYASGLPDDDLKALRDKLSSFGVGISCRKGRKPETPNQDNILFCKTSRFTIAGVADGHGEDGHWASTWVAFYAMSLVLTEVVAEDRLPSEYDLVRIFNLCHEALTLRSKSGAEEDGTSDFDLQSSGSTLSLCFMDHQSQAAVSAWVGDSRAVMITTRESPCKGPQFLGLQQEKASRHSVQEFDKGMLQIQSLTADHNPRDIGERQRIMSMHGRVSLGSGRVQPGVQEDEDGLQFSEEDYKDSGLAMTRALGDLILHSYGVIHKPGHKVIGLEQGAGKNQVLVCCSDGVWEFIDNQEAARLIATAGRENVAEATEELVALARARWLEQDTEEETDDLSAIVVWL